MSLGYDDEDRDHSVLTKRKLEELAATPNSRSSGIEMGVGRFFVSGSPEENPRCGNGGSDGYKVRDAGAGASSALTPVVKRRAMFSHKDDHDTKFPDTHATAADASVLLALRSSEGPRRYGYNSTFWLGEERNCLFLEPRDIHVIIPDLFVCFFLRTLHIGFRVEGSN